MLTFGYFNHAQLHMERRPLPDAIAQRVLDFFLESKKWHADPEAFHRLHRTVIAELRALPAPEVKPPKEPEPWVAEAIRLREQDPPTPWRTIEAKLGKPQSTIRRAVAEHLVAAG